MLEMFLINFDVDYLSNLFPVMFGNRKKEGRALNFVRTKLSYIFFIAVSFYANCCC